MDATTLESVHAAMLLQSGGQANALRRLLAAEQDRGPDFLPLYVGRQLAGDAGVKALGPTATITPPGTKALGRLFQEAGRPVLLLFDEVLNFLNRHRDHAE